jgi:hypothetical protein
MRETGKKKGLGFNTWFNNSRSLIFITGVTGDPAGRLQSPSPRLLVQQTFCTTALKHALKSTASFRLEKKDEQK